MTSFKSYCLFLSISLIVFLFADPTFSQTIFRVPSEYPTIQSAVDEVGSYQDIVLIAPGIYSGEGNRDIQIDGETVTIKGDGSPEDIIIDAGGSEGNVHNVFNVEGYSNYELYLRNLTLKGAWGRGCVVGTDTYISVESCVVKDNQKANAGGGIYTNGGQLFCNNSYFFNNETVGYGGAVYSEYVVLNDCTFESNYAGISGGGLLSITYAEVDSCHFLNNEAKWDGGGITLPRDAVVVDTIFNGNSSERYGGGCHCYLGSHLKMDGCAYIDNTSAVGGGLNLYNWIDCSITDCLFIDNHATYRGGGAAIGGIFWTQFFNNTICDNSAAVAGGGLLLDTTHEMNLTNSIIWNNSAPVGQEINLLDSEHTGWEANVNISNTVLEESETLVEGENHHLNFGEGIIPEDPGFVNPEMNDYQLAWNSVCIDNGTAETSTDTDAAGLPRLVGLSVDIGAFEFQEAQEVGTHLSMTDRDLTVGDNFLLDVLNVTGIWGEPIEMVVMLDIHGALFFYPYWQSAFSSIDSITKYGREWQNILTFTWPDDMGSSAGLTFWGAILNPEDSSVIGEIDAITWNYY